MKMIFPFLFVHYCATIASFLCFLLTVLTKWKYRIEISFQFVGNLLETLAQNEEIE